MLNIGQQYGEFIHLKIENMTVQHNQLNDFEHVEEGQCACGEEHVVKPQKPENVKI